MAVILRSYDLFFWSHPPVKLPEWAWCANNADFFPLTLRPKANLTPCASTNWPIHQP